MTGLTALASLFGIRLVSWSVHLTNGRRIGPLLLEGRSAEAAMRAARRDGQADLVASDGSLHVTFHHRQGGVFLVVDNLSEAASAAPAASPTPARAAGTAGGTPESVPALT